MHERSLGQYDRSHLEAIILGSRVLYIDGRLSALSLENHHAARFWAAETKWCIESKSWFEDYRQSGKLILFSLLKERRRYLLSPANLEFRNTRNRRVSLRAFIERFPNVEASVRQSLARDWRALFHFELARPDMHFDHGLDLNGLRISSLPCQLSVRDDLVLRYNPITTLPADLIIGGNLDIRDTGILSIPASVQIMGRVIR
jgi:hypothetical protein